MKDKCKHSYTEETLDCFHCGKSRITTTIMTNNIKNIIERQREEFDEEFPQKGYFEELKSHHTQSTIKLLEGLKEEVRERKQKLPKRKCLNAENHMFGSCFSCEKIRGHNAALQDFQKLLSDTIKIYEDNE